MPEDKDFKRLVRARMADTGEPYTAARAGLRPELSDVVAQESAQFHDVVPMDLAALEAWRRDRPRPVPGEQPSSFGPHWELTVDAGGRLDALEPQPLDVATVAAFGSAVGGVAYIAFGLDVLSPAPEGSEYGHPGPPPRGSHAAAMEPLQRAHAHLQQQLREHVGLDLAAPTDFMIGRARRQDGGIVVPGRSGTTVLLNEARAGTLSDLLNPWAWSGLPGGLQGEPWAAYGVVLHIERRFPTRQFPLNPPPGFSGPYRLGPVVDDAFWETAGETFRSVAAGLRLPQWPMHQAKLHDPVSGSRVARNWQQPV